MPACLATPVLQVDTNVIHQVDTQNPDSLFSMWTGESKTPGIASSEGYANQELQFLPSAQDRSTKDAG